MKCMMLNAANMLKPRHKSYAIYKILIFLLSRLKNKTLAVCLSYLKLCTRRYSFKDCYSTCFPRSSPRPMLLYVTQGSNIHHRSLLSVFRDKTLDVLYKL